MFWEDGAKEIRGVTGQHCCVVEKYSAFKMPSTNCGSESLLIQFEFLGMK